MNANEFEPTPPVASAVAPPVTVPAATGHAFRKPHIALMVGGFTALVLGIAGAGIAVGVAISPHSSSISSATDSTTASAPDFYAQPGSYDPSATASTSTDAVAATDEQQVGVVTIVSTLYYDSASQAAGTGIILSSTGEILTNNHVIAGATEIEVTVESTGETYTAEVVGTDATADVAVLQLDDASGLTAATLDSTGVAVADAVTSVGNANGTGDLVAAAGTVTALDESIEVGNEYTGATESLTDLIEIDADVVSGDSGGPLVDADGEVVGIVTAASSGTADITGYAIEIDTALAIVDQIEAGTASDNVVIGTPAFLGVTLADTTTTAPTTGTDAATGVELGGVIDGLPAADAGLVAGDTITAVDGNTVSNAESLSEIIASHEPGESVTITYLDATGESHSVTVTLVEGPAA